ncbi:MAG TPA: glycoside hydrolase family 2 TIM barrel-domain containing protein [Solirubrobacteraceae bacterium]|nr:glycoside hydrolase family 2 TIM barrel-domain containing protein [Solirubrobacteraceae bacterium]
MPRPLIIAIACVVLVGCGAGAYLVLRSGGSSASRHARAAPRQTSADRALLARAGGPDGSAPVILNRWRYRADPSNRGVTHGWADGHFGGHLERVPFSPNAGAHSGAAGVRDYDGSVGWYAREIDAPVAGQYALRFESAHYRAAVYVDGKLLRRHVGAYEAFSALSTLRAGRHTVAVRVDWRDPDLQAGEDWQRGWFNYGGIDRPVTLTRLGPSRLGALTLGTRLGSGGRARVSVTLRVRNREAARRIRVTGALVRGGASTPLRFPAVTVGRDRSQTVRASVVLDDPDLWSPDAPNRYDLRIAVPGESTLEQKVGLRQLTWNGSGLFLNGAPLVLRGAALPADARGHGDALTPADENRMVDELRTVGANATRSQLPLAQSMLDRLDAAGIFVWQEIGPWEPAGRWRATTPAQIAAARDRALRTAEDDQTHASVLAWTLTNEAPGEGHPGQQVYVAETAKRLHASDPTRPVAADLWGSQLPRSDGLLFSHLDAIGVTDYIGWYEGPASAAGQQALAAQRVAKLRGLFPGKPLVVTELGAAGSARTPGDAFGSLDYQASLLARRIRGLNALDGLSGTLIWSLRDYALRPDFVGGSIATRMPGLKLTPGLNEKGLYDFDGKPKPALAAVRRAFDAG